MNNPLSSTHTVEIYFLFDNLTPPREDALADYIEIVLQQLPRDLKKNWLRGAKGEVLRRSVFEEIFAGVHDLKTLKTLRYDTAAIRNLITATITDARQYLPLPPQKYFVLPQYGGGVSGFCFTATSMFLSLQPSFAQEDLVETAAHEYFHAGVMFYELKKQTTSEGEIFYRIRPIMEELMNEGFADHFSKTVLKVKDSFLACDIPDDRLKEALRAIENNLLSDDQKTHRDIFLDFKNPLLGKKLKYGIGYYLGYFLARCWLDRHWPPDWSALAQTPLKDLFLESWKIVFGKQAVPRQISKN